MKSKKTLRMIDNSPKLHQIKVVVTIIIFVVVIGDKLYDVMANQAPFQNKNDSIKPILYLINLQIEMSLNKRKTTF